MIAHSSAAQKEDPPPDDDPAFARRVVAWYRHSGRHDLPWQRPPTPYRVWVSEIMLQQTRVGVVVPYFLRFMERFPALPELAAADVDEVLHLWSGLGYYARGRNLHAAARMVLERHGGEMPATLEGLMQLPGIGRSTAGAILSLALGQRQPILDGNVKRVLCRCFAVEGWPGRSAVQRRLWRLSDRLTPARQVREFNQAMMDLGAELCTRHNPACPRCPLSDRCRARAGGDPTRYPEPKPRRELPVRTVRMLILRQDDRVLLQRRPPTGVWGGLWSLPECPPEADPARWSRERLGLEAGRAEAWPTLRHSFSHYHLEIQPMELQVENSRDCVMEGADLVWYNTACPDPRGLPAPVERMIRRMTGEEP